ncbi:hypothetical protein ACJMK2_005421 [Sinanodonta woodiana]|uniref:Peptidoglycan-recognition protein n=1 Tax=Sinanodonta woodiana TaxID=1069815 RepID=A0ABD3VPY9_SINWO
MWWSCCAQVLCYLHIQYVLSLDACIIKLILTYLNTITITYVTNQYGNKRINNGANTKRSCMNLEMKLKKTYCPNVNIVHRSAWGAAAPTSVSALHLPVSLVFIQHTETPACHDPTSCKARVKNIQQYHMSTNGNFLVVEDGTIYEGRGLDRVGAHTMGYNSRGIAFSFIGSYSNSKSPAAALTAVKNMIQCGITQGKVDSAYHLYGHRDVNPTSCPGDALYHEIQTWPHYSHTKP